MNLPVPRVQNLAVAGLNAAYSPQPACARTGVMVNVDIRLKGFFQYINVSYLPRTTVRTNRVDPITLPPLASVVIKNENIKEPHPEGAT